MSIINFTCNKINFYSDKIRGTNKTRKTEIKPPYEEKRQTVRHEKCSLKNAINGTIGSKLFCFAYIGHRRHDEAFETCNQFNSTLPLPASPSEHTEFVSVLKRLGIQEPTQNLSVNIVLNTKRDQVMSQRFLDESGQPLWFTNWQISQPNNFGNDQNHVSISYSKYKWGDWSGDTIGTVVCQQEINGSGILLTVPCT